jgi:chromosome segregation ATPase
MPRSLIWTAILSLFAAFAAAAQSQGSSTAAPSTSSQDSAAPTETKKSKKVWTNENLSGASGTVSVVGDPKNATKPKPAPSKPVDAQYLASVRNQLAKLQGQVADIDKQLVDLKNFSEGEPSTSASGLKLNKSYEREPIEVQMRALRDQKKDLESKMDALQDEARKRGVDSSQLR